MPSHLLEASNEERIIDRRDGPRLSFYSSQIDGAFMFYLMEFNPDRIVTVNVLHEICETLQQTSNQRRSTLEIMHSFCNSPKEQLIYRRPGGLAEFDYVDAVVSKS